tara:strand:- start:99 stop:218 length:120 start_codon:yes stop_codon:yes gene_type:complete
MISPAQSAFGWGWWSKGLISDNEFIKGIEYLVKSKIIKV